MSIIPPGIALNLQFYLSGPLPCPYIPAQVERKLFTRLDNSNPEANAEINAALCRSGFRRSHDVVYRPACNNCNACLPVRIPVQFFDASRSLRRVLERNSDLSWSCAPSVFTDELFSLFSLYQAARHSDSDMARMSAEDFAAMLHDGQADTHLYQLRDSDNVLLGCVIADHVGDGLSAVYSFFTPDAPRRSLGTALILSLVQEAQDQHWPFVYLGYYVEPSRKMAYKARFRPLQYLGPNGWDWLTGKEGTML